MAEKALKERKIKEIDKKLSTNKRRLNTNPKFIKKAYFLDGKDDLDEKDLEIIVDEIEKIEAKKETKEIFSQ